MCGRFTLRSPVSDLVKIFDLMNQPDWPLSYNIAPTQQIAAVQQLEAGRKPVTFHWGLIPSWAKDSSIGSRMINARAETVATKPSFCTAFRRRRCLILADGFFEWTKTHRRTKQPYYISRRDDRAFAFAGLWEHWQEADALAIDSCTIVTVNANELLSDIHTRMPVILRDEDYDQWLDPDCQDVNKMQSLLKPYIATELIVRPVNTIVNNPRHNVPECIETIDE